MRKFTVAFMLNIALLSGASAADHPLVTKTPPPPPKVTTSVRTFIAYYGENGLFATQKFPPPNFNNMNLPHHIFCPGPTVLSQLQAICNPGETLYYDSSDALGTGGNHCGYRIYSGACVKVTVSQ